MPARSSGSRSRAPGCVMPRAGLPTGSVGASPGPFAGLLRDGAKRGANALTSMVWPKVFHRPRNRGNSKMALPGSILLSADTLALAEGYVRVKALGLLPVKGLATPLEVYEATGAAMVRSRFQAAAHRGLTRFVGRESELEQLHRALEGTRAGQGQGVAGGGGGGGGKTRLYWELS